MNPFDCNAAQQRLRSFACPEQAAVLVRFFKTGPGQYGEGDRFLGVKVPVTRKVAAEFKNLPLSEVECLLHSKIHEDRLLALVILVGQFEKGDSVARKQIYDLYLANTRHINNWDLVDLSAPQIVGGYLWCPGRPESLSTVRRAAESRASTTSESKTARSRQPLYRLAKSSWLWDRRIAILATFYFIRQHDFDDTLKIAEMLLGDAEDLIHKAVGWMLREVGKRSQKPLEAFLDKHVLAMPRTMLRYAIEKFPEKKRQAYLAKR